MSTTVLVTGATGAVGREVCRRLSGTGVEVRGGTREPVTAATTGLPVTRWVRLDYKDPQGFGPALEGVDRLFLIARPGDPDPAAVARPLLKVARAAGVRRVVNLTALGVERRDDIPLRQVERLVEGGGFSFTHLRPNWFMQVFGAGALRRGIRTAGRLAVPAGNAPVSYVDARDVGAVAARTLLEDGHGGRAYDLTGGESLTHSAIAEAIGKAAARPVEYRALTEDEARAAIVSAGLSRARAERLIGFYRLVRAGHCAPVSRDVQTVLARPPIPFARFAADHADLWRPGAMREVAGFSRA